MKTPSKAISCLVGILLLMALTGLMWGFWLLLTRAIFPLLLDRIVPNPEQHRGVGEPLNFLELEPLTGGSDRVALRDLKDHVVLLSFWGVWCRPCRNELPRMAELRKRFAGRKEFRLISISYPPIGQDDDLQSLREETDSCLKRLNVALPTYHDPQDALRIAMGQRIEFRGFPTSVLLDRRGVIRAVWVGYRPGMETEMERYIDRVLGEGDGKPQPAILPTDQKLQPTAPPANLKRAPATPPHY
jgi:thiol-disulfide isomerase/thioredoxin